jgi:rhodanese-related sulfurtransferase
MVDPAQAQTLINQNQGSSAFSILDVRTAEEFASGHLPGAADIDIYQASFQNKVSQLDRHKTYLVYCLTGIRSAQAAQIMLNLGFPAIYDLRGGITQWIQAGMSVVK